MGLSGTCSELLVAVVLDVSEVFVLERWRFGMQGCDVGEYGYDAGWWVLVVLGNRLCGGWVVVMFNIYGIIGHRQVR